MSPRGAEGELMTLQKHTLLEPLLLPVCVYVCMCTSAAKGEHVTPAPSIAHRHVGLIIYLNMEIVFLSPLISSIFPVVVLSDVAALPLSLYLSPSSLLPPLLVDPWRPSSPDAHHCLPPPSLELCEGQGAMEGHHHY